MESFQVSDRPDGQPETDPLDDPIPKVEKDFDIEELASR